MCLLCLCLAFGPGLVPGPFNFLNLAILHIFYIADNRQLPIPDNGRHQSTNPRTAHVPVHGLIP